MLYLLFIALLMPTYAFGAEPMLELRNGGVSLGRVTALDCTGAGLTCSTSIGIGSLISSAGSPADAVYWVGAANGTLSAEHNLGALSTGLVLNTAGTPSAYAGTTCTNQVVRMLSASGAATCLTITSAYVDTSIWTGTAISGLLKATSQGVLTAATGGVDYANASHAHAISDTTGTLSVGRGGTGQTTITTNQVYIGTALDTVTAKTLPSCSNATTSKLLYNNSTNEFSCGTDQTGGGGSLTISSAEINFGTAANYVAVATITDAGVSGSSKILTWQSGAAATGRQADENEMDAITCNANPGSGSFTLRCHTLASVTHGLFPVFYTVQ